MEMEIDLRAYVDTVLRRWPVVLVVFLAATVVATVASFLQSPTYEATVTLVEQSYEFSSLPQLELSDREVVKLYPTMARTRAVESRVIEILESSLSPAEKIPGALLSTVTIEEDKDNPALFEIKVQADDPEKAVLVANTWAEQYLQLADSLDDDWSGELEVVEQNLEAAEEALAAFQERSGLGFVVDSGEDESYIVLGARGVEFERKAILLAEHRQARDKFLLLLQKAQAAKEAGDGIEDLPFQLLSVPAIVDRGQLSIEVARAQEDLDALISAVQAEETIISEVIDELAAEVEQLQEELAQDILEERRLVRAVGLAEGAYQALTEQARESQLFQNRTQILSKAVGSKAKRPNRGLNIALGAALGLVGGILAALAMQYFQQVREEPSGKQLQAEGR